ncbi:MAG TPA: hypothetical protein VM531_11395, partial [Sphingomicrobium sp.]|nr:hypothetical protein [Sphingomicrobium sp.]
MTDAKVDPAALAERLRKQKTYIGDLEQAAHAFCDLDSRDEQRRLQRRSGYSLIADGIRDELDQVAAALRQRPQEERPTVTTETGISAKTQWIGGYDGRLERATELCRELVGTGNGNVPIQSVYEAMMKLIGRDDVIEQMQADWLELLGEQPQAPEERPDLIAFLEKLRDTERGQRSSLDVNGRVVNVADWLDRVLSA